MMAASMSGLLTVVVSVACLGKALALDLGIEATPLYVESGLTKSLNINCGTTAEDPLAYLAIRAQCGTDSRHHTLVSLDEKDMCPPEWNLNRANGRCYRYFAKMLSYADAIKDCKTHGAVLPVVNSDEENTFLFNLMKVDKTIGKKSKWEGIWLAADDIKEEKTWVWQDGRKMTYKKWAFAQPDNAGRNEDCASLASPGSWNDIPCGSTTYARLVCSKPGSGPAPKRADYLPTSAKVSGRLQRKLQVDDYPFLSVDINKPGADQGCRYVCTATTRSGDNFITDVNVIATEGHLASALKRIATLEKNAKPDIGKTLDCMNKKTTRQFQSLMSVLFSPSELSFNNITYYLSQHSPASYINAARSCKALGGTLAKLNSERTYNFIKKFLQSHISDKQIVLIDGTDAETEGKFIKSNDAPLGYGEWFKGQPDNWEGLEHCAAFQLTLNEETGLKLNDVPCDSLIITGLEWTHSYLCEVKQGNFIGQQTCG